MVSLRELAEAGAIWSGAPRLAARTRRGRTLILAYHNVVPDAWPVQGDRSLHMPESAFGRQLDRLIELADVVPLSYVLVDPPPSSRPRVIITFDDGYHGALTLAAAALRERGLPATMFVPPALLGRPSFWWDAFAGPEGVDPAFRTQALEALRGDDDAVRAWAAERGTAAQAIPAWLRPGTEAELTAWVKSGFTVGSHSWRHANLARLVGAELVEELARPMVWLRERFAGAFEPWLTYPYGRATRDTAGGAREAGYRGALLVSGGWAPRPVEDPFVLPRLNVPSGVSMRGFELRLAGLSRRGVACLQQVDIQDGLSTR
jgi:peptidoglycan/xylan/chitin deacetylase (PgdA/CDA1 family)